jgi:peptidyl-prolyl cis-trans isomerase C
MTIARSWLIAAVAATLLSTPGAAPADAQGEDRPALPDSFNEAYQAGEFSRESSDPIIANVEGRDLRLSALGGAIRYLPESARNAPFYDLYPVLLEILVEREALLIEAYDQHLDDNPAVEAQLRAAPDALTRADILGQALIERSIADLVTEDAIRARYQATYGGKPGEDQARVRLIVLGSGPEAQAVIDSLNNGADFATLAAQSIEPATAGNTEFGWVRRDQMRPEIADVAFTLKPGQVAPAPVMTDLGFTVVKLVERRFVPSPSLDQARASIRLELTREVVDQVVKDARAAVRIRKVNMDGSPLAP